MPEEERLSTLAELERQRDAATKELNMIPPTKYQLVQYQTQIKKLETEAQARSLELERYSNLDKVIAEAKSIVTEGSPIAEKMTAQIMDMTRKATVLEVQEMPYGARARFWSLWRRGAVT